MDYDSFSVIQALLELVAMIDYGKLGAWKYTDIDRSPERTPEMTSQGQVWVWMQGPGEAHFEVRGTGLRLENDE